VGALLHGAVTEVLAAYTDRLRAAPAVPRGAARTRVQLEDHAISFLADFAQPLVIVGNAGPEAVELLKDGSAIQRTVVEAHGARRFAQGFDEAALRRDQQVFREEVERAVRARLKAGSAWLAGRLLPPRRPAPRRRRCATARLHVNSSSPERWLLPNAPAFGCAGRHRALEHERMLGPASTATRS
jgi:hypothetical protein